jgi:hypothetical protein
MTSTIITKNSAVAGLAPSAGQLVQGELAVNVTDKKIYSLDDNGNVVLLSTGDSYNVPVSIDVSSSTAALRVTQRGSGNALLVEDSTNPDATPVVVDNTGKLLSGHTTAVNIPDGASPLERTPQVQIFSTGNSGETIQQWSANTTSGFLSFGKGRSATIGNFAVVSSGDNLGVIGFCGTDGVKFVPGASIIAAVDGTPGTNDMPGRLVFSTTGDGFNSPAERLRINNAGAFGLAGANFGTAGQAMVSAGSAATPSWVTQYLAIPFIIDGGGSPITTGIKGDLTVPFDCVIEEWTLLADASGSIVMDIWKDTYANYPPTAADTITGSAKPTISAAAKGQSSTLTGWTTTITAGDILRFNVDSTSGLTRITLSLKVRRV